MHNNKLIHLTYIFSLFLQYIFQNCEIEIKDIKNCPKSVLVIPGDMGYALAWMHVVLNSCLIVQAVFSQ